MSLWGCLPLLTSATYDSPPTLIAGATIETVKPTVTPRSGLVVAAPHDGFDLESGALCRQIAADLNCMAVVARGFRSLKRRIFVNVNRPTENVFDETGKRLGERVTDRARATYESWQGEVDGAADACGGLRLYVEIHGHARKCSAGVVETIEVATVGFDREQLEVLANSWKQLRDHVDLPPLYFDMLDPRYSYGGVEIPFHYRASQAKQSGSLHHSQVTHALHIELPPTARSHQRRQPCAKALSAWIGEALTLLEGTTGR